MELEFREAPNLHQKESIRRRYERILTLPEIKTIIPQCVGCPARLECQGPLPPQGPLTAEVIFIMRSPSHEDERTRSLMNLFTWGGGMFREMLTRMGLKRKQVYLTASIFCHTQGERIPRPPELLTCFGWKYWEMANLTQARFIIPLGDDALFQLMGFSFPATRRSFWGVYRTEMYGREAFVIPGQHLHHLRQAEETILPTIEWCGKVGDFIRNTPRREP